MRPVFAVPLFAFAFALGFNTMGKVCMVRTRVARAMETPVSTTTITSASVDDPLASVQAKEPRFNPFRFQLSFELARIPEQQGGPTFVFVKPVGWAPRPGASPTALVPPEKVSGFYLAKLEVSAECDGQCGSRDWQSVIDAKVKEAKAGGSFTNEERLPDGRVVIWGNSEDTGGLVRAYWFEPGAPRYYSCRVSLQELRMLRYVDAFVEICKTARVEK